MEERERELSCLPAHQELLFPSTAMYCTRTTYARAEKNVCLANGCCALCSTISCVLYLYIAWYSTVSVYRNKILLITQ